MVAFKIQCIWHHVTKMILRIQRHWHTLPEVSGSLVPIGTKDVLTVVIITGFGYGLNRKSR